jgi:NADPH:quinone reductase-like Zn-dependent oxidoreductase
MQAIVQDAYGSAEVLRLEEVDRPQVGADEVLVRVHAAGVDFGVWNLMAGIPYAVRLVMGVVRARNPIRGLEVAGVVEAIGEDVTAFKAGDEVFGIAEGSFAGYTREDFADGTRKYDTIIDLAGSRPVSHLRRALTPTGTLVILGGEGEDRWLGLGRQLWSQLVGLFSRQRFRSPLGLVNQKDLRALAEGHSRGKSVIKVR